MRLLALTTRRLFRLFVLCYGSCLLRQPAFLSVNALTTSKSQQKQQLRKPVQRVAIIGAGIAGLTLAHGLEHTPTATSGGQSIHYDLFDARPGVDAGIGAGIQLNGGLNVLGGIDPALRDAVYAAGLPQEAIQSEAWYSGDGDADHATMSTTKHRLFQLNLPELIRSSRDPEVVESLTEGSTAGAKEGHGRVWWISILRSTLQSTLVDALPKKDGVKWNKRLIGLERASEDDESSYCVFDDGSKEGPYQVVAGCEGINSVLKDVVDGRRPVASPTSSSAGSRRTALYSGIRIRFAVSDQASTSNPDAAKSATAEQTASFVQHLGRGIYALDSIYGGGGAVNAIQRCAFIVYLDPKRWGPFPRLFGSDATTSQKQQQQQSSSTTIAKTGTLEDDENADWNQEQKLDAMRSTMQQQLADGGIHDATLQSTIASATQCFELGSYFHWPFGSWSSRPQPGQAQVVLCGDAAHALPPFLGQGANQAMQDAYCLMERLVEYNNDVATTTRTPDDPNDEPEGLCTLYDFCKDYEHRRWPSTTSILVKSIFLGYLETGGFDGVFAPLRNNVFRVLFWIGAVPKILLGAAIPRV